MGTFGWYTYFVWRGRIVAECATLERWYVFRGIEGSNPSLSAKKKAGHLSDFFLVCDSGYEPVLL
jgi:hypothetical protein